MNQQTLWASKSKKEQIQHLEKGLPAPSDAGIFGLSLSEDDSDLCIISVPWEATTSYGGGTAKTPGRIIEASHQLDLYDLAFGEPFSRGISLLDAPQQMLSVSEEASKLVGEIRREGQGSEDFEINLEKMNALSKKVNQLTYQQAKRLLVNGKIVGLLGGDHSCPYGLIKALTEVHDSFAIVHVDAHFDFRDSYEGFKHSHASIMFNTTKDFEQVKKIYQVGIRDFSKQELNYQKSLQASGKSLVHFSGDVFKRLNDKGGLAEMFAEMNTFLPEKIYVSFDIDGLDPKLCPGTGTPVPGGLDYEFTMSLLESFKLNGKKVIGFDLCEVAAPEGSEWDLNVGARVLYKLCGLVLSCDGKKRN